MCKHIYKSSFVVSTLLMWCEIFYAYMKVRYIDTCTLDNSSWNVSIKRRKKFDEEKVMEYRYLRK